MQPVTGMTQDELAAKPLVTRAAVSKRETGRGWPGVDGLKLIADEFGCTIDSLVSDEDVRSKRDAEGKRRALASRIVVTLVVLVVMMGFVGIAGTVG